MVLRGFCFHGLFLEGRWGPGFRGPFSQDLILWGLGFRVKVLILWGVGFRVKVWPAQAARAVATPTAKPVAMPVAMPVAAPVSIRRQVVVNQLPQKFMPYPCTAGSGQVTCLFERSLLGDYAVHCIF